MVEFARYNHAGLGNQKGFSGSLFALINAYSRVVWHGAHDLDYGSAAAATRVNRLPNLYPERQSFDRPTIYIAALLELTLTPIGAGIPCLITARFSRLGQKLGKRLSPLARR